MRKIAVYLGLFVMAVLAPYVLASPAYDVSVEVGPPKTAKPGDLVTLVFIIENTGTVADQYDLELTRPTGWTALPIPTQVSLGVGESARVFLTVIVPAVTAAGTYNVVLRATSTSDTSVWAEATGVIKLVPTAELELEAFKIARAQPGTEARHIIQIRNTGNVVDTYRIEVEVYPDWTMRVSPTELQILPGGQDRIVVVVLLPDTAAPGTRYYIWVEATSQVDPAVTETLMTRAAVAPPPPEKVRVELYPELPLTIRMDLTEEGEPEFGLSIAGKLPGIGRVRATRSLDIFGLSDQDASFYTSEWGVKWGSVSVAGAYASIAGEGLKFSWDETGIGRTNLLLIDEGKGIAGTLYWEGGTLRFVSVGVEDEPGYGVNEIQFSGTLSETFSLAAILAGATTEERTADAFQIKPRIRTEGVSGHLALSEVSPGFPERAESEMFGWGLSFGDMESPLTGGFSTARTLTLMDPGPPQVFTTDQDFQATASISPNQELSFELNLDWEDKGSDDTPKTTDEGSYDLSLTIAHTMDTTSWSLGTSFKQAWDDVAGTEFLTQGLTISTEMSLGQTTLSGSLGLQLIRDLVTNTVSETSSSFSLSLAFLHSPFMPTIGLTGSDGEASSLSAGVLWSGASGSELRASFVLSLVPEGEFSTTVEFTFPVLFPFFGPTHGLIQGRAFIDENKNSRFDPGEEGEPGLLLSANGQQAVTGSEGQFVFWPLLPGRYRVRITEMPFGLSLLRRLPIDVSLTAGQTIDLCIPVESKTQIGGAVFHDRNQNGVRDGGEEGLAGVEFLITNIAFRKRVHTDQAGRFLLDVIPGSYRVTVLPESLPPRAELTSPATALVSISEREYKDVSFAIYQRPRPIVVTFGPPKAEFSHTPLHPTVGRMVSFDASASEATGVATIERFEWRFQHGAASVQRSGQRVEFAFAQPGTWTVSLTVTDSNEMKSSRQKVIEVAP